MNNQKQNISKSDLLNWGNQCIKNDKCFYSKIQQFGNGIGYLYILQHFYQGTVNISKAYPKAQSQYECLHNLKILANSLSKLQTSHPYDMKKICQMKFQDNFNMLQWLYNFTNNNKGIKRVEESTIRQSRSKKINIVPAEKRTINLQDKKFKKIDSDDTFYFQTKKVSTPTKKLNDIDEIIHNNANKQNDEVKLERIKEILFKCKKSQNSSAMVSEDGEDTENNYNSVNFPIQTRNRHNRHTSYIPESTFETTLSNQNNLKSKMDEQLPTIIEQQQLKVEENKPENPFTKYTVRDSILKRYGGDAKQRKSSKQESKNRVSISNELNVFQYPEERLTENSDLLKSDGRRSFDNADNLLNQG